MRVSVSGWSRSRALPTLLGSLSVLLDSLLAELGPSGFCRLSCALRDELPTPAGESSGLELLKFREAGVEVVWKDIRKRWDRQSQAFYNLFRQADRVEKLAEIIQRLEQGDLKLRVRTLESERAFQRVATVQKTVGNVSSAGILASAIMRNAYLFGSCLGA
ncbi:protein ACTIVITY OF BC1 COMPLEX KINASE 8, chloroplastic-like [Rosa rugosa]|uniref:protein ACTIVITY OF BC1 COMPLEX KINASE 8, chloroplastic-like n=1 Tax=Rosa rugosa TaxID=74645 RepID=UPI002B40BE0B|nr:protein ACTIVITY OF BC1 COMPLEX KINASE 8, chloroplastic-like [Rosa rugosa]